MGTTVRAKDGSFECELGKYLGEGREGRCYQIVNISLGLDDVVLKEMFESQRAFQILRHIEQILTPRTKKHFSQIPSLNSLLVTPFISEEDKCCLLMPRAQGKTLDEIMTDETSRDTLMNLPLDKSLLLAYQVALGIKGIHEVGIIHADIADPNVIVDISQVRAFIIDIDGGGVVNSLTPRIKGHHGDWMAPELQPASSPPANQNTDCWSLAVVLHEIITGLSPFYFCDRITEIYKYAQNWPPAPGKVSTEYSDFARWHHQVLNQIGDLTELFKRVFGPSQKDPTLRPRATEWERYLGKQLGNIPLFTKSCPKCGYENKWQLVYCGNCVCVLHQALISCPHCRRSIPVNSPFCRACGRQIP